MKILVLGYFGYCSNKLDGQTVKTRSIYELLKSKSKHEVLYFDTELLKTNKLLVLGLIKRLLYCHRLIYLPAHGNLKYLFPFLYLLSIIFRFRIIYVVIGGWLVEYLKNKPFHRILLKRIKAICSETQLMKIDLENKYSFSNVTILPNFRKTSFIKKTKIQSEKCEHKLKLVFMARIQILKGLDYIQKLAEYISQEKKEDALIVDFYGQIDNNDRLYFNELVSTYSFLKYKGSLSPQDIHTTLCKYDLLLLPTHYYTEGFPGSVLDAYIAGIPVLVTKWKHATEFVENQATGFIIPFDNGTHNFIAIINSLLSNKKQLEHMKHEALNKGKLYSDTTVWKILSDYLEN